MMSILPLFIVTAMCSWSRLTSTRPTQHTSREARHSSRKAKMEANTFRITTLTVIESDIPATTHLHLEARLPVTSPALSMRSSRLNYVCLGLNMWSHNPVSVLVEPLTTLVQCLLTLTDVTLPQITRLTLVITSWVLSSSPSK
jgi:hypothetical protein